MNMTGPRFEMSKLFCLSFSVCSVRALMILALAAPALAHGQKMIPASGYSTGETIEIGGWEKDLVRRNKGLEKFHWSAINTVQRYHVVQPGGGRKPAAERSIYLASKPKVVSRWSNTINQNGGQNNTINNNNSKSGLNGQFLGANPGTYWSIGQGYETKPYSYRSVRSEGDRQVSGRVMHY